ncbi:hypothetical protein AKJ40_02070 [candidate division MSBL1 archaeon SCGC-AAA259M10]|uniref:Uncharacterized protein n=2 Tax=candidate division MSBL1 TaxID=215777 RepID=A0A133U2X0_9EURY|nr:hypothetical protein AKJ62_04975 [candidate division MSBL1 archaeon SCGC-AAA259D14]KXA99964.1 hypothetical protein AKJ40_02070 [candidate division MSBL1 archaeon SCGC-AAA259M10]
MLFTTHEDWSVERVIKAYTGKWRVEHSFRLLKGPISVRPVYHGEDNRIREHYFLLFLLLVIHRWLMERIRGPVLREFGIGEEAVLHFLKELRMVTDKPSNSNKPDFKLEEQNEIQEAIVNNLNLKRFVPGEK